MTLVRNTRSALIRCICRWSGVVLVVWGMLAALGFSGWLGWLGELPANFGFAIVAAGGLGLGLLVVGGGRRSAMAGLLGLAAASFAGHWLIASDQSGNLSSTRILRFATWNSWEGRLEPVALDRWIAEVEPDVIAFTEITKSLHRELRHRLRTTYPFTVGDPRNGFTGLAVFSKVPVSAWSRPTKESRFGTFLVEWPGGGLARVLLAHPPAPLRPVDYARRATQMREMVMHVAPLREPLIALGDFNATPASIDFRDFCQALQLEIASGSRPSWPAYLPRWFRAPIDHVLADRRRFVVTDHGSGDTGGGSDHCPVWADLAPRAASPPSGGGTGS